MLLAREHVDDAVERLGAVVGVQGREHQMPRAGQAQGRFHTLPIADFPDQDDIGRGAHHTTQRA